MKSCQRGASGDEIALDLCNLVNREHRCESGTVRPLYAVSALLSA